MFCSRRFPFMLKLKKCFELVQVTKPGSTETAERARAAWCTWIGPAPLPLTPKVWYLLTISGWTFLQNLKSMDCQQVLDLNSNSGKTNFLQLNSNEMTIQRLWEGTELWQRTVQKWVWLESLHSLMVICGLPVLSEQTLALQVKLGIRLEGKWRSLAQS